MRAFLFVLVFPLLSVAAGDSPKSRMSGWESLAEMQNGNMRFFEGKMRHGSQDPAHRESLTTGQRPHTIIVSCSDSRLPPETVFDQGLGDVFTVRLAGNVMTPEAIASVEYAVEHLGSKLLLVMGHESCGAVGAAVAARAGHGSGSESLDSLVTRIRGNLSATAIAAGKGDKTLRHGVKENVTASLQELVKKSEIVRRAVVKEGLVLGQAIYSLKSGRVEFWDVGAKLEALGFTPAPVIKEQKVVEEVIPSRAPKQSGAKAH